LHKPGGTQTPNPISFLQNEGHIFFTLSQGGQKATCECEIVGVKNNNTIPPASIASFIT